MAFPVLCFVMHRQHLAVLALKSTCENQHDQHQQHLEGGDGQDGEACLNLVASNAGRSTHFTQHRLEGVGRRC